MKNAFLRVAFLVTLASVACLNAHAGLNAYLELNLQGEKIEGEPNQATIGGVNVSQMIECSAFEWETYTDTDSGSGRVTGRTTVGSLKLVKSIDKSSPLILAGLTQNQVADGTIHFFHPNSQSGETEEYYTITFSQARIVSVREWLPSTFDPIGTNLPILEEFRILAETITVTNTKNGTEHTISTIETD